MKASTQVLIMPDGRRIETPVLYLDHRCAWCDEPAVRFEVPECGAIAEFIDEQWCLTHLMKLWDIAKESNRRAKEPFRPWKPSTWWKAKFYNPRITFLQARLLLTRFRLWWLT